MSHQRWPTFSMLMMALLFLFPQPVARSYRLQRTRRRDPNPPHVNDFFVAHTRRALAEMERTGIPASLTLAQAILESGWGRSDLAIEAHNFFGIKQRDWPCGYWYKNSHYRCYDDVNASFRDHSDFLLQKVAIQKLLRGKRQDYKTWTGTLVKIGYAEDPGYAVKLNNLIAKYRLDRLDLVVLANRSGR